MENGRKSDILTLSVIFGRPVSGGKGDVREYTDIHEYTDA